MGNSHVGFYKVPRHGDRAKRSADDSGREQNTTVKTDLQLMTTLKKNGCCTDLGNISAGKSPCNLGRCHEIIDGINLRSRMRNCGGIYAPKFGDLPSSDEIIQENLGQYANFSGNSNINRFSSTLCHHSSIGTRGSHFGYGGSSIGNAEFWKATNFVLRQYRGVGGRPFQSECPTFGGLPSSDDIINTNLRNFRTLPTREGSTGSPNMENFGNSDICGFFSGSDVCGAPPGGSVCGSRVEGSTPDKLMLDAGTPQILRDYKSTPQKLSVGGAKTQSVDKGTPPTVAVGPATPQKLAVDRATPQNPATDEVTPLTRAINGVTPQKLAPGSTMPQKLAVAGATPNKPAPSNITPKKPAPSNITPKKLSIEEATPMKLDDTGEEGQTLLEFSAVVTPDDIAIVATKQNAGAGTKVIDADFGNREVPGTTVKSVGETKPQRLTREIRVVANPMPRAQLREDTNYAQNIQPITDDLDTRIAPISRPRAAVSPQRVETYPSANEDEDTDLSKEFQAFGYGPGPVPDAENQADMRKPSGEDGGFPIENINEVKTQTIPKRPVSASGSAVRGIDLDVAKMETSIAVREEVVPFVPPPTYTVEIPARNPGGLFLLKSEFDTFMNRYTEALKTVRETNAQPSTTVRPRSRPKPRPYIDVFPATSDSPPRRSSSSCRTAIAPPPPPPPKCSTVPVPGSSKTKSCFRRSSSKNNNAKL